MDDFDDEEELEMEGFYDDEYDENGMVPGGLARDSIPLAEVARKLKRTDVGFQVATALANVPRGGRWVVHGEVPPDVAVGGVLYKGAGIQLGGTRLRLPLDPDADAALLTKLQDAGVLCLAPFGHGSKSVTDPAVRSTLQAAPGQVTFANQAFPDAVTALAQRAAGLMGFDDDAKFVRASLHKLLIYRPGDHFKPHRDSVHEPGMFGTLTLELPSLYKGGELVLTHARETVEVAHPNDGLAMFYAAFFADVEHQVKRITSGARVVLTYNLVMRREDGASAAAAAAPLTPLAAMTPPETVARLVSALRGMTLGWEECARAGSAPTATTTTTTTKAKKTTKKRTRDDGAKSAAAPPPQFPGVMVPCSHLYPLNTFGGQCVTSRNPSAWQFAVAQLKGNDKAWARALSDAALTAPELKSMDLVVGLGFARVHGTGRYPIPMHVSDPDSELNHIQLLFSMPGLCAGVLGAEDPSCIAALSLKGDRVDTPRFDLTSVAPVAGGWDADGYADVEDLSEVFDVAGRISAWPISFTPASPYTGNEPEPEEAAYHALALFCVPRAAVVSMLSGALDMVLAALPPNPSVPARALDRACMLWGVLCDLPPSAGESLSVSSLMRTFPELAATSEWVRGPVGVPAWLAAYVLAKKTEVVSVYDKIRPEDTGLVAWLLPLSRQKLRELPCSDEVKRELELAVMARNSGMTTLGVVLGYEAGGSAFLKEVLGKLVPPEPPAAAAAAAAATSTTTPAREGFFAPGACKEYFRLLRLMSLPPSHGGFLTTPDRVLFVEWLTKTFFGTKKPAPLLGFWHGYDEAGRRNLEVARVVLNVLVHGFGDDALAKAVVELVGAEYVHESAAGVEASITSELLERWQKRATPTAQGAEENVDVVVTPDKSISLVLRTWIEARRVDLEITRDKAGEHLKFKTYGLPRTLQSNKAVIAFVGGSAETATMQLTDAESKALASVAGLKDVLRVETVPGATKLTKDVAKCKELWEETNETWKVLGKWLEL